jgi:hypothetical protein
MAAAVAGQSGSPAARGGGEWPLERVGKARSLFGAARRIGGVHEGGGE